ncbi:hypothetical protein MMC07_001451 [Pseudocyphellaria aurata]|nr:hypothetical protein [Pseudocyphellaria aurata]
MDSQSNIRTLWATSKAQRKALESSLEPSSAVYQENLQAAIATLDDCRRLVDHLSLFSPNETEDDIASSDLQYLTIDYHIAELLLKNNSSDRKSVIEQAQKSYERYLALLDSYVMLPASDRKLYERYLDNRELFSLMSSSDPAARRDVKIARFKQESQLKSHFEELIRDTSTLQNDDTTLRELHLAELQLHTHQTFHALDIIAQELQILSLVPPPSQPRTPHEPNLDPRQRHSSRNDSYSDRLDRLNLRRGKTGPILSKEGKPLQPFTLLDHRQSVRDGVFRPDHSLPTMTIDEYLAEEKRRGGMIDGGGAGEERPTEQDEDNDRWADAETLKAREWDEFKEANPRGSGNTLNRG